MRRRFRPRLSYANVVSTLALILALGGVSYAAATINGGSIKKRTISGNRLKQNTVTGKEVKESKLSKVPKAKAADTATSAATAGDSALLGGSTPTSFRDACPTGTTFKLGQCYETTLRTAANFLDALKDCGADGMRMPTFGELEALRTNGVAVGVPPNNYEISSSAFYDGSEKVFAIDPAGNRIQEAFTTARPYRCVGTPTNLP